MLFTECQVFHQVILAFHNPFPLHTRYVNPLTVTPRSTFLDMSKAFHKVWHDGLIYKYKLHGVENKLFNLIQNYLTNCQQRAILNRQTSKWTNKLAGVPQSSALGP